MNDAHSPPAQVACATCAAPIDPSTAYYSASGDMICAHCNASADIAATEGRAVSTMAAVGYGTLPMGLFSLFFNPMTLFSFLAVLQGSMAMGSLLRGDWYKKRLGWQFYPIFACALLGTIIGGLPYWLVALAIVFAMS